MLKGDSAALLPGVGPEEEAEEEAEEGEEVVVEVIFQVMCQARPPLLAAPLRGIVHLLSL